MASSVVSAPARSSEEALEGETTISDVSVHWPPAAMSCLDATIFTTEGPILSLLAVATPATLSAAVVPVLGKVLGCRARVNAAGVSASN